MRKRCSSCDSNHTPFPIRADVLSQLDYKGQSFLRLASKCNITDTNNAVNAAHSVIYFYEIVKDYKSLTNDSTFNDEPLKT